MRDATRVATLTALIATAACRHPLLPQDTGAVSDGSGGGMVLVEGEDGGTDSPPDTAPDTAPEACPDRGPDTGMDWGDCTFRQVSVGTYLTCALTTQGRVGCWGPSLDRHLGPTPGGAWQSLERTFGYSVCGLRDDGCVQCWSSDENEATDYLDLVTGAPTSTQAMVEGGGVNACALDAKGSATCWGVEQAYWFDVGVYSDVPTEALTAIDISYWYGCGLRLDGSLGCWGFEWSEDYEHIDYDQAYGVVERTPVGTGFLDVQIGNSGTPTACALDVDGAITCWGGHNFTTPWDGLSSNAGSLDGPFTTFSLDEGTLSVCGITAAGDIECRLENVWDAENTRIPGPYVDISVGGSHFCALDPEGHIDCWKASQSYDYDDYWYDVLTPPCERTQQ